MAREEALVAALANMPTDGLMSFAQVSGDIVTDGHTQAPWNILQS
ncbi:hypothetical protein [Nonomuraea cavernae]